MVTSKIITINEGRYIPRSQTLDFPRNNHIRRSLLRTFAESETATHRTVALYHTVTAKCALREIKQAVRSYLEIESQRFGGQVA